MSVIANLIVKCGLDTGDMWVGAEKGESRMKQFGHSVQSTLGGTVGNLFSSLSSIPTATAAAIGGLTLLAHTADQEAERIDKLAKSARKLGMDINDMGQMSFMGKLSGVEDMEGLLKKMELSIGEGKGKRYGLSAGNDQWENLSNFAEATKGMDAYSKAAAAVEVFGKAGLDIIPVINDGADGIEKMRDEYEALGLSLDSGDAQIAEEWNDSWEKFWSSLKAMAWNVASTILPLLTPLVEWAAKVFGLISQIIRKVREFFGGGETKEEKEERERQAREKRMREQGMKVHPSDVGMWSQQAWDERKAQRAEEAEKRYATSLAKLQEETATYGMSSRQQELYRLGLTGVSEAQYQVIEAISQKLDLMDKEKKAQEEAQKQRDKMVADGQRLTESLASPWEQLFTQIQETSKLYKGGFIDLNTFQRAQRQYAEQFANKQTPQSTSVAAVQAGSREMYAAMKEMETRNEQDRIARDALTEALKHTNLLSTIADNTRPQNVGVPVKL